MNRTPEQAAITRSVNGVFECPTCGNDLALHDLYGPVYRFHGGEVDGVVLICFWCNEAGRECFWHTKRADDHRQLYKGEPH